MNKETGKKCFSKKLRIISAVVFAILIIIGGVLFFTLGKGSDASFYGSELNINEFTPQIIAEGLQITSMGEYSGLYLEDGSDRVVSSVMMIVLENTSDKDLQLARIRVVYPEFAAEYEATNVPSGSSVVLLEKNCRSSSETDFVKISAENVVFFNDKMDSMKDTFEVIPGEGYLQLRNIGSRDIEGTTVVYYKNKAEDTLYGGITYRVKIEDPIPAGESVKVLTNHFTEKNTEVVQIVNIE